MRSKRQPAQAVVEFGMVALIFTLLLFAVVDLGLLLNSWVRLSGATREVARAASVGYLSLDLETMVNGLVLPGVSRTPQAPFVAYCCDSGDELVLSVVYYDGSCIPGAAGCSPLASSAVSSDYWGGTCPPANCPNHPGRGDIIVVSLAAPGMEVLTPLVRPFFGCASGAPHCFVRLGSTALMRYEGR